MLLRCEPELLDFSDLRGSQTLRLSSSGEGGCVAYKVRTTAPQQFAVAPVIGLLKPGEHVDVRGECAANGPFPSPLRPRPSQYTRVQMCEQ